MGAAPPSRKSRPHCASEICIRKLLPYQRHRFDTNILNSASSARGAAWQPGRRTARFPPCDGRPAIWPVRHDRPKSVMGLLLSDSRQQASHVLLHRQDCDHYGSLRTAWPAPSKQSFPQAPRWTGLGGNWAGYFWVRTLNTRHSHQDRERNGSSGVGGAENVPFIPRCPVQSARRRFWTPRLPP
jgi:hypothetical protein